MDVTTVIVLTVRLSRMTPEELQELTELGIGQGGELEMVCHNHNGTATDGE